MVFPQLSAFTDVALLLLRIMVGLVFLTSGWAHLRDPTGRSKSIEISKGFTVFLGAVEFAGALAVILGVFAQLAAIGLILVMLGADPKEDFRLAHRFLGQVRNRWMELRHDADRNEPHYRDHRRREHLCDELVQVVSS